jgi:DNA processing protein
METRHIVFGLHELEGIGWLTILKLVTEVEPLERVFIMKEHELTAFGLRPGQARTIAQGLTEKFVEDRLRQYRQTGIDIMTIYDRNYPELLRQSAQPPWVLYGIGDWGKLTRPAIGIVGSRTPTVYGKKVAADLGSSLADNGFAVVSGLARGIDGCAHEGVLAAGGDTIAVLGCPPDRIYPPENAALHREISRRGLIVTEYPLGTAMKKGMFPMRNRIIAGLSLGIVVVEAARESGSLLTAKQATDDNRDVFAVPGPITSPKSTGTLELLRAGTAKIVLTAEDIIEEYRHLITLPNLTHSSITTDASVLTSDECKLYELLSSDPVTADELMEHTQFTFGHFHSVLLSLITKKLIQPVAGSAYIAI